jgi:arylsulfatase A-like enzyme
MPVTRRELLASAALPLAAAPARRRPNVLVILADDQGWGDLSVHGNTNLSTPRIDSLARDGALFDRFFVCSVCAPTRAEFLTGRYHPRGGVRGVTQGAERLNLDETTVAQTFRASGYSTGAFGKWHNGSQFPYHPNARGFEEYYGFTSGHWGHYFDTEMDHNGTPVRGKGYITDDLTDRAIHFIAGHRRDPFFCYVPYNTPHSPMQVPDRFWQRFASFEPRLRATEPEREETGMTRAALAMCENIDWNVGRLLDTLDKLGLRDDTIVLYFSDNGPNSRRWNGGMKGIKGSVDEGGLRAPLLMRWPSHIAPGTKIPQIAGAIDLLPTLAALAGVPLTSAKPLDGRNLMPLLTGPGEAWPDRILYSAQNRQVSLRTQRFRLSPAGALYDMPADPGQTRDVAAEHPDDAARLRRAAAAWAAEVLPGPDGRPFPVGYSALTVLPARDGEPHGPVKRSSIHPNSSFFTDWRSADAYLTWDIEVGNAREFDAVVQYTCPEGSTGATLELSFLGASVSARVADPFDPPLVGAAQDRVVRTESYVKQFRPLRLGRIRLPKGRGPLTLRATEIPAGRVADIGGLFLTLA